MLHVTNGESVSLRETGVGGDVLAWIDVLHEGPVPAELGPEELRHLRGLFLGAEAEACGGQARSDCAALLVDAQQLRRAGRHGFQNSCRRYLRSAPHRQVVEHQVRARAAGHFAYGVGAESHFDADAIGAAADAPDAHRAPASTDKAAVPTRLRIFPATPPGRRPSFDHCTSSNSHRK